MTPRAALENQLDRYRTLRCEERVGIALRLHAMACDMARLGIRRQYPQADEAEVNRRLRERLAWVGTL